MDKYLSQRVKVTIRSGTLSEQSYIGKLERTPEGCLFRYKVMDEDGRAGVEFSEVIMEGVDFIEDIPLLTIS